MNYTVAQFIPIIIIFLFISYFKNAIMYSKTLLGKLLAVCIIIYYTAIDKIMGAFICLLIIIYYQSDIVENMLNIDLEDISSPDMDTDYNTSFTLDEQNDLIDDYDYLSNDKKPKKSKNSKEGLMNYVDLYSDDFNKDILINNEKLQNKFKKENCVNGELMNKDVKVNYEMTEHVFPEIKFRRGFCNPCLNDCEFSITEQKLETEKQLIRK